MRLDKFLKVSRIIKRRTVANEACSAGRVLVNSKAAKAGADVKTGDIVEVNIKNTSIKVRITELKDYVKKEDASSMYELI